MGGEKGLYGRLTGLENLLHFDGLNQLSPREAGRRADKYLSMMGLSDRADSLVSQYSCGMKQRLHLPRGLLTEPSVIFLEEPTIGLDAEAALAFRKMIPELAASGVTVLLTTHNMPEADQICERVAIINGKLLALGTSHEIKDHAAGITIAEIGVTGLTEALSAQLSSLDDVLRVESHPNNEAVDAAIDRATVHIRKGGEAGEIVLGVLSDVSTAPIKYGFPTLEECYLAMLRGGSNPVAEHAAYKRWAS